MSYFVIKVYAMIFMLIDHVGFLLLNDNVQFRLLGRIAFPLFAFLLVNGYYHTSNKNKYLTRMVIFAFISEMFFDLAIYEGINLYSQNVFFTLSIGLACIIFCEKCRKMSVEKIVVLIFQAVIFMTAMIINEILCADYGWYGIMLIYFIYLTYGNTKKQKIGMAFAVFVANFINVLIEHNVFQGFSILAAAYILMFEEKEVKVSRTAKILCYVFYPLHLAVLYIIKIVV